MTNPLAKRTSFTGFIDQVEQRDLLQELLRECKSPNTKRAYQRDLNRFFLAVTGQEPNALIVAEFLSLERNDAIAIVLKYKFVLKEKGLSENTINRNLAAIKSLVKFAQDVGHCGWSLEVVRGEKVQTYRDTSGVNRDTFMKVLAVPNRTTLKGLRDYAILRLIWENGLRRAEISKTNRVHFDPDDRTLSIWGKGKGMQLEAVTLSNGAIAAIEEWLTARELRHPVTPDNPLFISLDGAHFGMRFSEDGIYKMVRGAAEAAGLKKRFSPHRGRHSAITAALDATDGNVRVVQKLSRHADIRTLMIYDDNRRNGQGEVSNLLAGLLDDGN